MKKRIACIWEAGAGLGHLTRLVPIIRHAETKGYEVFLVAKELANIDKVIPTKTVRVLQAPYDTTPHARILPISWPETLLLRYRNPERLANYLRAWTSLFELIAPDIAVYDASPTALIASSQSDWQKWTVGSPFFMPRTDTTLIGVFPNAKHNKQTITRLKASEEKLLHLTNRALELLNHSKRHGSLRELVGTTQIQLVTSVPEFEYFGKRQNGEYVGMPASLEQELTRPEWPQTDRPRIFAYLKTFPGINKLLDSLNRLDASVVVYSREIPVEQKRRYKQISFLGSPASMDWVCNEAHLMIHMAGSQTVARCLAHGIPQVLIPTGLEQLFTAQAAERIGRVLIVGTREDEYDSAIQKAKEIATSEPRVVTMLNKSLLDGSHYDKRVQELLPSA